MLEHRSYLPRLAEAYYQGLASVHWTLTILRRQQGWLTVSFHYHFRELLLHTQAREDILCPVYCLMPDHIHLVWMGLRQNSNQLHGMAFLRTHLKPFLAPARFQHQVHDHVLREKERSGNPFETVCQHILSNPVRAGLAQAAEDWPYLGAVIPGYPTLSPLAEQYGERFWKLYAVWVEE